MKVRDRIFGTVIGVVAAIAAGVGGYTILASRQLFLDKAGDATSLGLVELATIGIPVLLFVFAGMFAFQAWCHLTGVDLDLSDSTENKEGRV